MQSGVATECHPYKGARGSHGRNTEEFIDLVRDSDDPTRKPEFYDPTFDYLREIGSAVSSGAMSEQRNSNGAAMLKKLQGPY